MIIINKGELNDAVFTLDEKRTSATSSYFLELYSNGDKTSTIISLDTDVSTNTVRYNKYVIDETSYGLTPGQHDYYVWETISATISTDYAIGIVESGKCDVRGTYSITPVFINTDESYTFE
jgi:hypothetical protein